MARCWTHLDWYINNNAWISNFESYLNKHLPRISSDHAPIFLFAKYFVHWKSKVFRFENYWFDYPWCHNSISRAWNFNSKSTPKHDLSHLISRIEDQLIKWRTSGMSSLEVDIRNIEADINLLEVFKVSTNSCDANSLALISLNNQHSALLKQNTIYWAQRARLMWVRYGDFNTNFFL